MPKQIQNSRQSKNGERVSMALGKMSYGQISRSLGVSKAHISYVMRGLRNPSLDLAARLAVELGVSLDSLYCYLDLVTEKRAA